MNSDMTKYCYQHFENAYNIGWNVNFDNIVESKETFDSIFIEKLTLYCENPLNRDLNGVCREIEIDEKKYVFTIKAIINDHINTGANIYYDEKYLDLVENKKNNINNGNTSVFGRLFGYLFDNKED